MAIFQAEELPLLDYRTAGRVEETFTQKPMILPLAPQPRELIIVRREQNWVVPIVAIVSLLSFFGFLAFLAYMRKS